MERHADPATVSPGPRTAALAALETAAAAGIEVCFANPGTTELPLVLALDHVPAIRPVLCLHENVATGAADAWGRLRGTPALALLHTGPGLANGMANLHNARKGGSPLVALVGDHASWHRPADPPLAMDLEAAAASVADAVLTVRRPEQAPARMAQAVAFARGRGGRVVVVGFPHDHQLAPISGSAEPPAPEPPPPPDPRALDEAADLLKRARRPCLFLGGAALFGEGLRTAGAIAAARGARLVAPTGFSRIETGRGLPPLVRIPYDPERAQALFAGFDLVLLAGAREPVAFFGWPDRPSRFLQSHPGRRVLARPGEAVVAALAALAERLDAPQTPSFDVAEPPPAPTGALDPRTLAAACVDATAPESVVVLTAAPTPWPSSELARTAAPQPTLASRPIT